ncbi:MAG: hypothetical protein H6613_12460 [Ignavibacteriales bacterium]|nr:hypothetical protein [Ignavibacteriales bacterium]
MYEFIFEALGYSKNKRMMQKLAQSVNLKFLNSIEFTENYKNQS